MNRASVCLLCYQQLKKDESIYHQSCCKKFYGKIQPPELPYNLNELDELAKNIVRSSVTVPGVQAKLSLHLAERGKEAERLTLVGLWGNYILKPPIQKYPYMPEIEDLTMHLASFFKIETVPHGLIPLKSGELAYITKRIDRDKKGFKLQMEDMCQLTERLTEDKYKGSMEQVAKVILKFASNPVLDVIRFFEVTLFSFITGNADMHLKNFSLIYDKQTLIHLSPAYDMLSTRMLISEKDDPEELALTLNGKKSNFKLNDFVKFAENITLTERQFQNSIKRFQNGFESAISFINKSLLSGEKSQEFKELLNERAERLELGIS
jgi:serine/threonine-protein kinase HipA